MQLTIKVKGNEQAVRLLAVYREINPDKLLQCSTLHIDTTGLPSWLTEKLTMAANEEVPLAPPPSPEPAAPPDDSWEKYEAAWKRDMDAAIEQGQTEGLLRKMEAQGLLRTDSNMAAIAEWHNERKRDITTASVVECLSDISTKLQWRSTRPAPPPRPKPEPQKLGTCSDGLPQIPLNVPEYMLKRLSIAQLKDWSARKRKGKQ
jgi:hypothetical protein